MEKPHPAPPPAELPAAPARRRSRLPALPWLRLLPGALAALLFIALVGGAGLLGPFSGPLQVALALAVAGSLALQPAARSALQRLVAWPGLAHTLALLAVLAVGALMRFWGLGFGLPYREHPDEWATADIAVKMLQTGDYSPHRFVYPTLYTYLQMGVAVLHFLWGASNGTYRSLAEIDLSQFYLWGRALTAVLGTGALALTYLVGRLTVGRTAGLLAAAFLAVYPAAAGDAHYITTDTPSMFFTLLAFVLIARLARGGQPRDYYALALLAGLAVGLATATKYNVAVLLVPLALGLYFGGRGQQDQESARRETGDRRPQTADRRPQTAIPNTKHPVPEPPDQQSVISGHWSLVVLGALWAVLGIMLGFTLGMPVWLRELPQLLNDLASVLVHYRFTGHPGAESDAPALFYWQAFIGEAPLLAWAFLGGVLLAFIRHRPADLLLLAFVVPTFAQISGVKVVFFRNTMPLLPFLCLLAATLVVTLVNWGLSSRGQGSGARGQGRPEEQETADTRHKTQDRDQDVGPPSSVLRPPSSVLDRWSVILLTLALLILTAQPLARISRDNWLRAAPTTRVLATEWVERQAAPGTRIWLEDRTLILSERLRVQGNQLITAQPPQWYVQNGFRYLVINADVRRNDAQLLAAFGPPAASFSAAEERLGPTISIYDTGYGDARRDERTASGATLGAGAITLDGYRHPATAQAGGTLPLALYWQVNRALPHDYTVFVHLLDAQSQRVAQRDLPPLDGRRPTSGWQPGELIRDDQDLALPAGLAPGNYRLVVGMYDPQTVVAINDTGPIEVGVVVVK